MYSGAASSSTRIRRGAEVHRARIKSRKARGNLQSVFAGEKYLRRETVRRLISRDEHLPVGDPRRRALIRAPLHGGRDGVRNCRRGRLFFSQIDHSPRVRATRKDATGVVFRIHFVTVSSVFYLGPPSASPSSDDGLSAE